MILQVHQSLMLQLQKGLVAVRFTKSISYLSKWKLCKKLCFHTSNIVASDSYSCRVLHHSQSTYQLSFNFFSTTTTLDKDMPHLEESSTDIGTCTQDHDLIKNTAKTKVGILDKKKEKQLAFVSQPNPVTGKMDWVLQDEDYDYTQEIARFVASSFRFEMNKLPSDILVQTRFY